MKKRDEVVPVDFYKLGPLIKYPPKSLNKRIGLGLLNKVNI